MNQKGFITPLLLALIALLLIGGGAYVYVHNNQTNQSTTVAQTTQATSTANYFEIKEVGLKFKPTDDIKDLTYSIINEGNGATYVWFSTKTLENLGGKNCNSDQAPLGGIGVWQKDISGGAVAITYLIKSNNFFVTYGTPQSICSSVKEGQDLQTKQLHSLSEALKTIIRTDTTTADWKTYTNSQYKFTFQYPPTATVETGGYTGGGIRNPGQVSFSISFTDHPQDGPGSNGFESFYFYVQPISNLKVKTVDDLYQSDVKSLGTSDYTIQKFDFGDDSGVLFFPSVVARPGSGCSAHIDLLHGAYVFSLPPDFGTLFAPQTKIGDCTKNDIAVSDEYLRTLSTFKFTK